MGFKKDTFLTTIADYTGHTIDLMAFQGVSATGEVLLEQALASVGSGGTICTGVQKLAQRWLIEFLTEIGSLPYLPLRGCAFMQLLRSGQLRTVLDGQQAFFQSAQQVQLNLQLEETSATPNDEAFGSVLLLDLSKTADSLRLSVQITSAAGATARLILPISTFM